MSIYFARALSSRRSVRGQPGFGIGGDAEYAGRAKVRLGHNLKHSQHAEKRVPGGHDGANIEPDSSLDPLQFIGDGGNLRGGWQRTGFAQVEEHVERNGGVGVTLELAEV